MRRMIGQSIFCRSCAAVHMAKRLCVGRVRAISILYRTGSARRGDSAFLAEPNVSERCGEVRCMCKRWDLSA
eukprot:11049566-Alexandrium_andersonii.AAC.1